jgi:antitoxin PrlF
MPSATITTKGQVTIPKIIRDSLLLNTGDQIEFVITNKREALIRPISKKVDDVFGKLYNPKRKARSIEEIHEKLKRKMKEKFQ